MQNKKVHKEEMNKKIWGLHVMISTEKGMGKERMKRREEGGGGVGHGGERWGVNLGMDVVVGTFSLEMIMLLDTF